ncbi:MAG: protease modulator HflK, partial [Planctomycetota bacterium]
LVRIVIGWFRPPAPGEALTAPIESLLRRVFLSTVNPIGALFDVAEQRLGLSLRASWVTGFVRRSLLPIAVGCAVVVWLSTCLVVIGPDQAGLRERFGVVERTRLEPGLHAKLPWPFGEVRRYPAGRVQTMQIGFEDEADAPAIADDVDRTLLWTKPHANEFSLVLGSETELVAVNAIVYFRIAEETDRFLDHALATANPETALEGFAYRVLMEETRSATLNDVLSRGRDRFAATIRERLNAYSEENRLGLDVIEVSLINLHPPVEVASSYLDVINADLDGARAVTVADGEASRSVLDAEQNSGRVVADASVEAARRVSLAGQESAEFLAVGEAFAEAPDTYRLRLWFEAFENVLFGRRLFIVDAALPDVLFSEGSRMELPASSRLPAAGRPPDRSVPFQPIAPAEP